MTPELDQPSVLRTAIRGQRPLELRARRSAGVLPSRGLVVLTCGTCGNVPPLPPSGVSHETLPEGLDVLAQVLAHCDFRPSSAPLDQETGS